MMSAAMGFFTMGLKNVFEIAVVNEPSVFEPLKFYCISIVVTVGAMHRPVEFSIYMLGFRTTFVMENFVLDTTK